MSAIEPQIPFPRVAAALRAGDLAFMRRHAGQIRLELGDAIRFCALIAEQDGLDALEAPSVRWIQRFAAEAHGQQRSDYGLIVEAFDALVLDPNAAAGELLELCASRGLLATG